MCRDGIWLFGHGWSIRGRTCRQGCSGTAKGSLGCAGSQEESLDEVEIL